MHNDFFFFFFVHLFICSDFVVYSRGFRERKRKSPIKRIFAWNQMWNIKKRSGEFYHPTRKTKLKLILKRYTATTGYVTHTHTKRRGEQKKKENTFPEKSITRHHFSIVPLKLCWKRLKENDEESVKKMSMGPWDVEKESPCRGGGTQPRNRIKCQTVVYWSKEK